jgi:GT2 family glycosyltransferase
MATETPADLYVVTVHYDCADELDRMLTSLPRRTPAGGSIRVHVLDNDSAECAAAAAVCAAHHDLVESFTISGTNLGFGEGVNSLVASLDVAGEAMLWILNPDTVVMPGCLDALEPAWLRGDYDVMSPAIVTGAQPRERIWYCGGSLDERSVAVRHLRDGSLVRDIPDEPFETGFITGAAPLMRLGTFRKAGGFPSGYFLYWEDVALSHRARALGYRFGVIPAARLWHEEGASSGGVGLSGNFYYYATRNRLHFAQTELRMTPRQCLAPRPLVEGLRYIARALREREQPLAKGVAAIRGSRDGLLRRSSGPTQ